ncbi:hypothetical protein LL473_004695 [Escherichia coli]|uniref:hypothetical protein n=2 Tax=Escherichia coli TaxID=562 RepID=UPI0005A65034|nr:hypothetical protein [Escherichia coli]EFA3963705.1 hypothetical protein [Escherichia coli]EFB6238889.1 hypothetical protein [Escherichia coli]EFB9436222.1 hypothetical protein [Escherichia coli]EFC6737300.1 hypothetical protein [Escherichia coli]EFC6813099.1 hypothetical protein [Escherichia coli]
MFAKAVQSYLAYLTLSSVSEALFICSVTQGIQSIGLSVYRFIGLSVYRFIGLSVYRFIGLSVYRFIVLKYHIVAINGNESVRMVINIPPERIYVVFLMAGYSESGQWLFIYKFMNENSSAAEFTFPVKFF